MASRKRTTSSSSSKTANPRLEHAKAVNLLAGKMDGFMKAVEGLSAFEKEALNTFDLEVDAKNGELKQLSEDFQHERKRHKIETDQYLKEYRYDGAVNILDERGEVPVEQSSLDELRAQVQQLTADRDEAVSRAITSEQAKAKAGLSSAINMCNLKHQAEVAELKAVNNQQQIQSENLATTIENLKGEVRAQRELTQAVANAARAAPITQNMGK